MALLKFLAKPIGVSHWHSTYGGKYLVLIQKKLNDIMQDESIEMIEVTPNNGHWNVETQCWHHCLILSILSIIMNSNNQNNPSVCPVHHL